MLHKTIKTIHTFRIFFLCFIIIAFLFNLGASPAQIGKFLGAELGAAIGMDVSVPENPFNKIAAQLKDKENRLAVKEQELNERELALKQMESGDPGILIYVMGGGIVLLFILILLNYYLDYARRRKT